MSKHMPEAPIAKGSRGPSGGWPRHNSQDTPGRTEHFRAGRNGKYQAEDNEQGLLPWKENEVALRKRGTSA